MFTQPSVNQIASTYQGNPAPLNQKVEADKKQNGGIPKDLRQLMAAYDIAEGRNAMGIQQALQIPTNMPTVAQDLQERARQALQAKMMQQAQEMQRKNGMPNVIPPGTPRPPMQAQGLDSLRTNVGEGYADGGIIGFSNTGAVKDPEEEAKSKGSWIERFLYSNISPAERARKDALEARAEAGRTIPTRINEERDRNMAIVNKPDPNKTQEMLERLGMATRQEQPMQQVIGQTPPKADAPPAPPRANTQTQTRVNAPEAPGIVSALPPAQTDAYKKLTEMMNQDPEVKARALKERYEKEVGSRDLSIYDQMAQELKARKERLNAPKVGYDATMEYLEQIALGGGRTSFEAGARGAAAQRALQKSRLAEQDVLSEKILDLGSKKSEAQFAEKKGMFEMTQRERDEIFKKAFDAAKSVNSSDDEAKRIAAQAVENELNRKNQIRSAQIGAQDRDNLMSRARALMAADPTKKMTLEQAMQRAGEIGNAGQMESADVRRLAAFNAAKDKIDSKTQYISMLLDKKNDPKYAQLRQQYAADIKQARLDAGLPALGINALPSAGGPTSSNIRSQADAIIAGGR
jgi:hypothetical protein